MKRTLQEHEDIACIPRAVSVLRDRELHSTKCLSDGELNHASVVAGDGGSIALDFLVKCLCSEQCVRIIFDERFNLAVIISVDDNRGVGYQNIVLTICSTPDG